MALKINLDSMIIPNVPRMLGGNVIHLSSVDSEYSSATQNMLVTYAKMVENTQEHNQSLIKHMESMNSE